MKINPLDAHDRYQSFTRSDFDIGACCQDMIDKRPFGDHPFYIFAHSRTDDDGVTKRMIWQPRLTRPLPQTNSMLFKGYPGSDRVKIIWMIPARELWDTYQKGKLTESCLIAESIWDFQYDRAKLEIPEEDDLSDEQIDSIYKELSADARRRRNDHARN